MPENYEEFISMDPEDKEFKETTKDSKKIGNTNGSRYALQDKQEQSEFGDSW